jgi:hypothetical protein
MDTAKASIARPTDNSSNSNKPIDHLPYSKIPDMENHTRDASD